MSKENNLTDFLTDVANAIREKKGTTDPINPQDFSDEIRNMSGGGGDNPLIVDKSVAPTAEDLGKFVIDNNTGKMYRVRQGDTETFYATELPDGFETISNAKVAYGNGRWVILSSTSSYVSEDTYHWTKATLPTTTYPYSFKFGGGYFMYIPYKAGKSYYSADGITWTAISGLRIALGDYDFTYPALAYGNNQWVCVGVAGGTIKSYLSQNLSTWSEMSGISSSSTGIGALCYGDGKFIFLDTTYSTKVYISLGSYSWSNAATISGVSLISNAPVVYADGRFSIITGTKLVFSSNGTNWNSFSTSVTLRTNFMTYNAGKYICCADSPRRMVTSRDGINWTDAGMLEETKAYNGAISNGIFSIVVGTGFARTAPANFYYYAPITYDISQPLDPNISMPVSEDYTVNLNITYSSGNRASYVRIYDGSDTSGTLLKEFTTFSSSGTLFNGSVTVSSGHLYIEASNDAGTFIYSTPDGGVSEAEFSESAVVYNVTANGSVSAEIDFYY